MTSDEKKPTEKLARLASFVLVMGGVLCVALLLYFIFYHARSDLEPPGFFEAVLHFVFPALFAALLLGSLSAAPGWRINLALAVLSTGVSLFAVNLFLMAYDSRVAAAHRTLDGSSERDVREVVKLAKKFGIEYDARGRLDVLEDLSRRGIDAVPLVAPVNVLKDQPQGGLRRSAIRIHGNEVLPHGGVSNYTTVYCNESGQYVIYQSDEHGFHNPKGVWGLRPLDILAIGDSFTQGACVSSDKNFVALIRKQFPRTLNLGMGGNGPLTALGALGEYLDILTPRIVLWFFFEGNDVWDLHRESQSPLLSRYLEENFNQGLWHRQAEIDQALLSFISMEKDRFNFAFQDKRSARGEILWQAANHLLKVAQLSHLRERLSSNGLLPGNYRADPRTRAVMEFLPSVLSRAKVSADAVGSKFYFVYLPQRERYLHAGISNESRERILQIVKELKIPIIDVHRGFQNHPDPLDLFPFRRGFHYNEKGHQLVADVVLQEIAKFLPE